MKKLMCLSLLALSACGYAQVDGEYVGQVKTVGHFTPLLCYDYTSADISLGTMRNGVGSMSTADTWVYVPDAANQLLLEAAQKSGQIVRLKVNTYHVAFCVPDDVVTSVEVLP